MLSTKWAHRRTPGIEWVVGCYIVGEDGCRARERWICQTGLYIVNWLNEEMYQININNLKTNKYSWLDLFWSWIGKHFIFTAQNNYILVLWQHHETCDFNIAQCRNYSYRWIKQYGILIFQYIQSQWLEWAFPVPGDKILGWFSLMSADIWNNYRTRQKHNFSAWRPSWKRARQSIFLRHIIPAMLLLTIFIHH